MLRVTTLVAAIVLGTITSVQAEPASPETCTTADGTIYRPIVTTAQAAREIYTAIAHSRRDKIKPGNKILVNDDGSHWSVFQYPARLPPDRVIGGMVMVTVVAGGGTLAMTINKCDGSLTAYYSK
jgi:hypothetical protein